MQQPTLTGVHIRTVDDAHKVFYAVQQGFLPKIEKRLDAHERAALKPGNVYVWEEKAPSADNYTVTMERFTEGKSWTASRVRDEFLMYYESTKKKKGDREDIPQKARSLEDQVVRDGERDLYIKLTYSVYRTDLQEVSPPSTSSDRDKDKKKPRKWHLNAYFTKFTEGQLRSIDDVPMLRNLVVPDGLYKTARSTAKTSKKAEGGSKASSSTIQRTYAPFPSTNPRIRQTPVAPVKPEVNSPTAFQQPSYGPPSSLPPLTNPPPSQPQLPPTRSLGEPFAFPSPNPQFPHQRSNSQFPVDSFNPYVDPNSGVFAVRSSTTGSGSSDASMMSPATSEFSNSWSPNGLTNPFPSTSQTFLPNLDQDQPHRHHSHTPSLSDSSHSSSSPFSISVAMEDEEEDLSAYVPAPPPISNGMDANATAMRSLGINNGGCTRVALAPLHSTRRTHPYRRSSVDDRALRLLNSRPMGKVLP